MKKVFLIVFVSLLGYAVNAQEVKKKKNAKIEFIVSGNCEMCKKRIEKAAIATKGVKSANWDMDKNILSLLLNEEKTNVLTIQKAIAAVGHDTEGAKASDAVYNNLHGCCQYERK